MSDPAPCGATRQHPVAGVDVHCMQLADHASEWHYNKTAPLMMYWPAFDACPSWTTAPTAQGSAVVFCGLPRTVSGGRGVATHPGQPRGEHLGWMGIFPVRW